MSNSAISDWVIWIPESIINDRSFYGPVCGLLHSRTMSAYVVQGAVDAPHENMIGYIEYNRRHCQDDFKERLRKKGLFFDDYHLICPSIIPFVYGWYENDELFFDICLTGPVMMPYEYMGKIIDHPISYPMHIKIYKNNDDIKL